MTRFFILLTLITLLAACGGTRPLGNDFLARSQPPITPEAMANNPALWQVDPKQVWARLQPLSYHELTTAANTAPSESARAWIDLAIISHEQGSNSAQLIPALIAWQTNHPDHPGNRLLPDRAHLEQLKHAPSPHQIALLLPLQGPSAHAGKNIRTGFLNAYYASLKSNPLMKPALSFYDTANDQPIGELYQEALTAGADQIVGPLTRDDVQALSQHMHAETTPVLTLNYTAPGLFSNPSTMIQYGLAPEDEAIQLAAHAKALGFSNALLIAPKDAWGKRVSRTLVDAWRTAGGQIADSLYFTGHPSLAKNIAQLLKVTPVSKDDDRLPEEHRRQDIDVIFLLASGKDARQIVPLLKFNYAGHLPILSISAIYAGTPNPAADLDLDGVVFCDIPGLLKPQTITSGRLNAVGHDAWLLATQIERLKQLPDFPITGMTGTLTLSPNQRIFRQLTWMKMKNGQPQPESR